MKDLKKVAIYVIAMIVAIMVANGLIDVFVGKYFVNDMFGFRDVIIGLFNIVKVAIDVFIIYITYTIYKTFN